VVQVDDNFDFADFVIDFLTEEFSKIVKLEFLMWAIAIIWIAFPNGSYAGFWMTGIFMIASVTAGACKITLLRTRMPSSPCHLCWHSAHTRAHV
jgi:hypothetical protein